jgi:xanthine permease XanP
MSESNEKELLYGLEARIAPATAFFTAVQHLLASVVGIITPPLIVGSVLGLNAYLPYLISMSLLASGIGTFIQARRIMGIGAGMICLQGTSFAFLGVILSGGFLVKSRGGSPEDIMAMIFGVNAVDQSFHRSAAPCIYTAGDRNCHRAYWYQPYQGEHHRLGRWQRRSRLWRTG